jgi:hypothetical protein
MTAFATTNQANLRYWTISAGIVLLMHGAIATAVLSWRNATAPAQRPGPLLIDLAPMPAAPPLEQTGLPPPAAPVPSLAQPNQPFERLEQKNERRAARGEEKAGPFEEAPRVSAPVTLAPPEEPQTRAATGGTAPAGASPYQGEPIDTRIGEPSRQRFKSAAKGSDWKKAITLSSPSKNFHSRLAARGPAAPSDGAGGLARNSIGMLTQDVSGVASSKPANSAEGVKNAAGIATTSSDNVTARNAGTATNAIAMSVPLRTRVLRPNVARHNGIGLLTSGDTTARNAVINGTGMVRPAFATAAIGGPAKNVGGVINGTTIRPR